MRILLLCSISCFLHLGLNGQKPIIDTSQLDRWPFTSNGSLSRDGQYAMYAIRNSWAGSMFFVSTNGNWSSHSHRYLDGYFLADSRHAVAKSTGDSLFILTLGSNNRQYIGQGGFFRVLANKHKEWLLYQSILAGRKWNIRDLSTGEDRPANGQGKYMFNDIGAILVIEGENTAGNVEEHEIHWWDLETMKDKIIWTGTARAGNFVFDNKGNQFAFISGEKAGNMIWYYKKGIDRAERWVTDTTAGVDSGTLIYNGPLSFSRDGKALFFQVVEKLRPGPLLDGAKVDIWHYKDLQLQEEQLLEQSMRLPIVYTAILYIQGQVIRQLQFPNEKLDLYCDLKDCSNYLLITENGGKPDFWWQKKARSSIWLVSVKDGSRTLLKKDIPYAHDYFKSLRFTLSPDEKYVVYYDPFGDNYFSYSVDGKLTYNITQGVAARWRCSENKWAAPVFGYPEGIAGWLEKDEAVLIYDAFDIWQVDPAGIKKPINVTNGYGLAHHIRLRMAEEPRILKQNSNLLLSAFDTASKYSGFYRQSLQHTGDPYLLTMGPYIYESPDKAENADKWVVLRQNSMEAPNYFMTNDLKSFSPLSDIHPQQAFNWMTAELVTWTLPDSSKSQGLLYKPENFDSSKRYPLLVHYYEERSDELNRFKMPEAIRDEINIPYFVSRGYLVFIPDIHYKLERPGESVVNTVVSGVRYLAKNSWVDSTRMGLQGHSFGGWETNYLITHTHIFAAAAEGAGSSDLVSSYGGLSHGASRQYLYEVYQGRIRHNLWERQDLYIENSPIYKTDQVTTPLLMMHNKRDESVPWAQAVEFFTALRRQRKRVWMLQYDEGSHFVQGRDALDYTIRMTQFFDHYLKGQAPPRWMTEGIPARKKGLELGYELDGSGKIP